jgi:hypothetical protein
VAVGHHVHRLWRQHKDVGLCRHNTRTRGAREPGKTTANTASIGASQGSGMREGQTCAKPSAP